MKRKFHKHALYEASVQDSGSEVSFWLKVYRQIRKKKPSVMREDFCATFLNSCEWIKKSDDHKAIAIDISSDPLNYGKRNHFSTLNEEQQSRLQIIQKDALKVKKPKADLITVSNFSICFFKERAKLVEYFRSCVSSLERNGITIVDLLGGTEVEDEDYEERNFRMPDKTKVKYIWEQDFFNPVTRETRFYIHYKVKGEKRYDKAFTYNWRMWTIPELRDAMLEAGFKDVAVYWEGDDEDEGGNGVFSKVKKSENCESWIAYIAGIK